LFKDTAFLDRVYDIVSVPPPCASAVYTILSNIFNELIDAEMITYDPWAQTLPLGDEEEEEAVCLRCDGESSLQDSPCDACHRPHNRANPELLKAGPEKGFNFLELGDYLDKSRLPTYERLAVWEIAFPDSPGPLLKSVAKDCAGFSGRKLAKLPFLAITKYAWQDRCTIFDAIKALQKAVKLDKVMN
jgi:predicted CXXCH cytochrome family protein